MQTAPLLNGLDENQPDDPDGALTTRRTDPDLLKPDRTVFKPRRRMIRYYRVAVLLIAAVSCLLILKLWLKRTSHHGQIPALPSSPATERISMYLIMESLCPDTTMFMQHKFNPTYDKVGRFMNVRLLPFGKAHWTDAAGGRDDLKVTEVSGVSFDCQHGEDECLGNIYMNCAAGHAATQTDAVAVVACAQGKRKLGVSEVETMLHVLCNKLQDMTQCPEKGGLNHDTLVQCATGVEGKQLMLETGKLTFNLLSRVRHVPTLIVGEDGADWTNDLSAAKVCEKLSSQDARRECTELLQNSHANEV